MVRQPVVDLVLVDIDLGHSITHPTLPGQLEVGPNGLWGRAR